MTVEAGGAGQRRVRGDDRGLFTGVDVVIPVHNEQEDLRACLDALDRCIDATPLPVSVTVVLDACSDGSEDIARGRARIVHTAGRNVGAARARGFATLGHASPARTGRTSPSSSPGPEAPTSSARIAQTSPSSTPGAQAPTPAHHSRWYATTDADSRVPRTWLTDQLDLAHAGADVVAGLMSVDDWSDWAPATRLRYLAGYHPGPGHRHIHGANIGLSARAYHRLGGFAPLPLHEDVAMVHRAQRARLTVAWSTATPVTTSARRTGRAPGGFSAHLAALDGIDRR